MNTLSIKKSEIDKHWWIADADGQVLGRFASRVAQILRGKHKVNYTPHMDTVSYTHLTLPTKRIV